MVNPSKSGNAELAHNTVSCDIPEGKIRHNSDTIMIIKEMYIEGYSMDRIARAINMSPSYISIVINWYFPEISKKHYSKWLEIKIDIEMLLRSGETIPSIANILGKKIGTVRQYVYRNIRGYGGTNNIDEEKIKLIGEMYASGKKYKEISKEAGISEYYIRNVIGQFYPNMRKYNPDSMKERLSEIQEMLRGGYSYKRIAEELGISEGNAHALIFRHFPASRRGPRGGKFVKK
ncbi:RNA polymerase sigma factor sigma-70 region 4 domain-containing protein [Nitrospirillum pindoramense]|uniref:Homeodomain-like domain-containing protein n=1 Tax=Nitrospirillum amazonense TaxID=28077 RepID=A0A560GJU3_9PROT|nr:hypothetical protein [Nitrospirillum amazonense]TWB33850.1 hypothetical protein FBZ90_12916 [Nitrospirillum amazonense]